MTRRGRARRGFGVPAESYGFANKQLTWETVAPSLDRASPLRTAHLRYPVGPQIRFASESFIDEIAAAIGAETRRGMIWSSAARMGTAGVQRRA